MNKAVGIFEDIKKELFSNKKAHSQRIYNDEIKAELGKLFEDKIGEPYTKERLEELINEGEKRYNEPPPRLQRWK